jgi:hypothetical protein
MSRVRHDCWKAFKELEDLVFVYHHHCRYLRCRRDPSRGYHRVKTGVCDRLPQSRRHSLKANTMLSVEAPIIMSDFHVCLHGSFQAESQGMHHGVV